MKKLFLLSVCLSATALQLGASVVYWDNNGTSTPGSGNWDTSTKNWATSSVLTTSTVVFPSGYAAVFQAGGNSVAASTVTVTTNITIAGIFDNGVAGSVITNLTINASAGASISLVSGQDSFTSSLGSCTITVNAPLTGAGQVYQGGGGSLALYGNNSYSGGTGLTGGQVIYYNQNTSFGTGPINVGGSGNALVNGSTNALVITNNFTFPTAGYLLNLAGGNPVNGSPGTTFTGSFSLPTGTTTLETSSTATQVIEIAGTISGASAALYVNDLGTLELAGTNTYGGATTVTNPATLMIIGSGTLGSGTYSAIITNKGTFTYASSANQTFSGAVYGSGGTFNVTAGVLTLSGSSDNSSLNANISGTGKLILAKSSSGTVHGLGSTTTVGSGATLQLAGSGNNQLYDGITFTVNSGGLFDLNAKNEGVTSGVNLSGSGISGGGAMINSSTSATSYWSNGVTMAASSSIGGAGNLTILGVVSGAGNTLTKVGAGTLQLNGANSYSGNTVISSGTLALSGSGSIGSSANIIIPAGSTLDVSGLNTNYQMTASNTLSASGTGTGVGSTAATIKGGAALTNNLGSSAINLNFTPTSVAGDTAHPSLYISQGALALNGNTFTVTNAAGSPLGVGVYTLVQVAGGNVTVSGTPSVTVVGSGIVSGASASIKVSGGAVNLIVSEPASFSGLTPSQSIPYGTSMITLGGTISAPNSVYPAMGETVSVTINGVTQTTTTSDSTGDFSINYNTSATPANGTPYPITYGYAGSTVLVGVTNSGTTLTVSPINQTITFNALPNVTYGVSPIGLTATASSGLTVSYSVLSGPASVSGSTLTITGAGSVSIQASQAGNGNYNAATPVTNSFTVNPLAIDLYGSRAYDGTNDATNTILAITNEVMGDAVSLQGSGTLSSADIGTNALVSFTNFTLTGTAATNYTLSGASGAVVITPLAVVLTGTRAYDGTNDASASILDFATNYDGTNLGLSGTGLLAASTAGVESIADFSGLSLTGSAATNYTLTGASGSVTVTSLPLTITATSETKTYGSAYSPDPTAFTVSGTLVGSETPTAVTMTASGGTNTTDPVSGSPYSLTPSAATGTGGFLATNYNITYVAGTLTVNPLPLVLTGARGYDGTSNAAYGILSISNAVGGDDVSLASGAATLAAASPGPEAITSGGSLTLGGTTAPDYTLTGVSGTVTISATPLTITANAQTNTYGSTLSLGTTAFTVQGTLASGESVTGVTLTANGGTASNSPVAGSPYTITPSAAVGSGGFNAADYTITYVTNQLTVNPLAVVLGGTRVYDGTANAAVSILSISNALGGDDIGLTNGPAGLASADIGTNGITTFSNLTLTGTTATDYTLTGASGSVVITPLAVVLTGTRVYDGTNDADASSLSISNAVAGDDVSLASGSAVLAGSTVGPEAITSPGTLALGGTTSSNYSLAGATGSVLVTPLPLTITATSETKIYGSAYTPDPTAFTVSGTLVGSETPTAVTMTASGGTNTTDPVSGSPYSLTPSAATGTGGFLATNYNITYVAGSLTVNPLPLVLTGTRAYDGTGSAAASILSISNVVGSDDVNLASGAAVLASASVGTEPITSAGTLVLGGTTAPDYTLTGVTGAVVVTNPNTGTNNTLQITSANADGSGNLVITWNSIPGVTYSILTNASLGSGWTDIGSPLSPTAPAATNTDTATIPGATNGAEFVLIKQN
jgi:autotransporter-associated beta strand protein